MSAPTAEELKLEGVRKRIGGFTLEASFSVAPGERAALLGPSGSGKTSLLRLIAGLESPDSGRILLGGADLARVPAQRRGIGLVFQEQALFGSMSVLENAMFGLRMHGLSRPEAKREALSWLERVGLAGHARGGIATLSGGERQRLALVRALAWRPKLLLLDEPFSAVDRAMRERLRAELIELHRSWPVPLLLVTHDASDIEALATRSFELDASDPELRQVRAAR